MNALWSGPKSGPGSIGSGVDKDAAVRRPAKQRFLIVKVVIPEARGSVEDRTKQGRIAGPANGRNPLLERPGDGQINIGLLGERLVPGAECARAISPCDAGAGLEDMDTHV